MTNESTPAKNNKPSIIIAILLILVIIQGIKIVMDYRDKGQMQEELTVTSEELDSTMTTLKAVQVDLESKIAEIERLGGDITELTTAKEEIEAELRRTRNRNAKSIKSLQDKIEGYRELLVRKDQEIEQLKQLNTELHSEVTDLKTTQNTLNDTINNLKQTKEVLASKVAIASQLKTENLGVMAVNKRGRERKSPFRNRHIEHLKIQFNIASNKIAPIGKRTVMLRIIDQSGQVIFNMENGSGTFLLNGKETFYTTAKEVLYDNSNQVVVMEYVKGSDYGVGRYTAEIYADDYLMGQSQFEVR